MEKILLTVSNIRPRKKIFSYAVNLCSKIKCQLIILQVINPQKCRSILSETCKKLDRAQRFLETTLSAAAYAEAGADDWARQCLEQGRREIDELLFIPREAGVPCSVDQTCGPLVKQMSRFLSSHPEVVMTVFDDGGRSSNRARSSQLRLLQRKIPLELGIPLIIPQDTVLSKEPGNETLE